MVLKKLLCLCNDNSDCVLNPLPEALLLGNLTSNSRRLGHCETSSEGGCYTVKDVTLPLSESTNHKRRQADYSTGERFKGVTEDNFFEGVHSDSVQQRQESVGLDAYFDVRYGCLSSNAQVTLSCNAHLVNHLVPKTIACCNSSDFCNAHLSPKFFHHSTPKDAYDAAVKNWRMLGQVVHSNRKTVLSSGLNIGPNLLTGGKPIYNLHSQSYPTLSGVPQHSSSNLLNVIFGTVFGVIAMALVFSFLGVYCCYRQRLRKGNVRVLESHLWYPSPYSHRFSGRRVPSASVVNSWTSRPRPPMTRRFVSCIKQQRQTHPDVQFDSATHTISSNLTRTVGSSSGALTTDIKAEATRYGQRTISRQVCLKRFLGRGRFSDVWMGLWRGEPVTLKIFVANARLGQVVWRRTVAAHRSMLLRHRNIQGMMAADWIHYPLENHQKLLSNSGVQCTIGSPALHAMYISELFSFGTLQDLMARYVWLVSDISAGENGACSTLQKVYTLVREDAIYQDPVLKVTDEQMLKVIFRLALSLVQGLCFIHSDYVGTRGKPALAHRDLKPSNVFVRSDWTCCIGDIGFSVRAPPNPLPAALSELNRLYCQHNAHLQANLTGSIPPTQSSQPIETCMDSEQLCIESRGHPIETPTHTNLTVNEVKGGIQLRTSSRLTVDKAELLDWWPVGGMQTSTPRYMAPELLNNSANPFRLESHQRADIYSLSLILWELITWAVPQHLCPKRRQWSESSPQDSHSERSSPDPVVQEDAQSLTFTGSRSLRMHRPAYQWEWEKLCARIGSQLDAASPSLSLDPLKTSDPSLSHAHSMGGSDGSAHGYCTNEPNVITMRQLVCDLQLRPRLPTGMLCGSKMFDRLIDTVSNSKAHFVDHDTEMKHISGESSSSGASSLKDATTESSMATVIHEGSSMKIELSTPLRTVISHFDALLPECWSSDPDSRLTALRVRKTLERTCGLLEVTRVHEFDLSGDPQNPITFDGDCVSESMAVKETPHSKEDELIWPTG